MKQKILILVAVFFGLLAAYLTYVQINAEKQKINAMLKDVCVLQIKRNIGMDEVIAREDLEPVWIKQSATQIAGRREVPARDLDTVIGWKAKEPLRQGQNLFFSDLVASDSLSFRRGFSGQITEKYRAVTITVDAVSSISGLIQPQDHIDVLGTFKFPDVQGDKMLDTRTVTLLQNVVVLACGPHYNSSLGTEANRRSYSTLTLKLTPQEAEAITFASQKGRLTCTLRSPDDTYVLDAFPNVDFKYLQEHLKELNTQRKRDSFR